MEERKMYLTKVKSGEARTKWRDILDQVFAGKGDVIIERNGKEVAAVIPAEDYAQVREMLEEMRAVREAEAAYLEWQKAPSVARPLSEIEAELISE